MNQLVLTINLEECGNIHLIQCRINTMVYIAANTQSKTFFPGNGMPNCFGMRAELKKMVKEFIVHPETKNRQITDFKLNESKCKTRQKNYCTIDIICFLKSFSKEKSPVHAHLLTIINYA